MELRQLRIFLKSAETLNFSEAAKQLFMTVSALTQNIKQLEDELGTPLFDRTSHEVFLTEAGEMFIDYAKNTLQAADEGKARIQDLANIHTGKLRIGITHAFTHMMTEIVPDFCKRYPNVEIEIRYKTVEELMTMLCAHELDFVLCYKPTKLDKRIVAKELYEDKLGVIMRSNHSLAGRQSVSAEEISKYQFALPSRGLHARTRVEGIFAKHGVKPKVCVDLNVSTTLLGFVRKSKMLSMLACRAVDAYPDLCAVPLEDPDNGMTACIHTLKGTYCKNAQKEFEKMIDEYIDFHQLKKEM